MTIPASCLPPQRTHDPADGVVRTGHGPDLALEHGLLVRGKGGGPAQGKAVAQLQADFLSNGGQGFLQMEGACVAKGKEKPGEKEPINQVHTRPCRVKAT